MGYKWLKRLVCVNSLVDDDILCVFSETLGPFILGFADSLRVSRLIRNRSQSGTTALLWERWRFLSEMIAMRSDAELPASDHLM